MSNSNGDNNVYHKLATPMIFEPVFEKLEQKSLSHTHTLKQSFAKVEQQYPGFSQNFLMSILTKLGLENEVDMSETFLRMASMSETGVVRNMRKQTYSHLETKAHTLKEVLSRIPDEIGDRRSFLDTIKEIASAIKNLLDCVSEVITHLPTDNHKTSLEQAKRDFVKYSKRFSNTLKAFFRDNKPSEVYASANLLVNQTNMILLVVRDAA